VPASTGVAAGTLGGRDVLYINYDSGTTSQETFSDGVLRDYDIEIAASVGGSGTSAEYALIDCDEDPIFRPTVREAISGKVQTRVFELGDWDMDTTASKTILVYPSAGIDFEKIVNMSAVIMQDSGTPSRQSFDFENLGNGYITIVDGDGGADFGINLVRTGGGEFDDTPYNATGENRGFVKLEFLN